MLVSIEVRTSVGLYCFVLYCFLEVWFINKNRVCFIFTFLMFNYEILVILTILFENIYNDVLENIFILFLINMGVRASLRVPRLIS
jgi:hypothetical protein